MRIVEADFDFGQEVYLKTDKEQMKRIVTGILVRPTGIQYHLSCGTTDSWHYEFEVSIEKNELTVIT